VVLCSSRVCWLHTQISDRYQIDLAYLQYGKECTADPLFTQVPRRGVLRSSHARILHRSPPVGSRTASKGLEPGAPNVVHIAVVDDAFAPVPTAMGLYSPECVEGAFSEVRQESFKDHSFR